MDAGDGGDVGAADGAAWVNRLRTGSRLRGGADGDVVDDGYRDRVRESAGRALTVQAEVLQRRTRTSPRHQPAASHLGESCQASH